MLVQAPSGDFIALFPVHDKTEDASFRALLVKGAVEVSASWSAATQAEHSVSFPHRDWGPSPRNRSWTPRTFPTVNPYGKYSSVGRKNGPFLQTLIARAGEPRGARRAPGAGDVLSQSFFQKQKTFSCWCSFLSDYRPITPGGY